MKTPDEYLDEYSTDTTTKGRVRAEDAVKAMKAYASDACKLQRVLCSRVYMIETRSEYYNSRVFNNIAECREPYDLKKG